MRTSIAVLMSVLFLIGGSAHGDTFVDAIPSDQGGGNTPGTYYNGASGWEEDLWTWPGGGWTAQTGITRSEGDNWYYYSRAGDHGETGIENCDPLTMTGTGVNTNLKYDVYAVFGAFTDGRWPNGIVIGLDAGPMVEYAYGDAGVIGYQFSGNGKFSISKVKIGEVSSTDTVSATFDDSDSFGDVYFDGLLLENQGTAVAGTYVAPTDANTTSGTNPFYTGGSNFTEGQWQYPSSEIETDTYGTLTSWQSRANETPPTYVEDCALMTTEITGLDTGRIYDIFVLCDTRNMAQDPNLRMGVVAGLEGDPLVAYGYYEGNAPLLEDDGENWAYAVARTKLGTVQGVSSVRVNIDDNIGGETSPFNRVQYGGLVYVDMGPIAVAIPGDANGDGCVDDLDLTALAVHWQQATDLWEDGDFNGDGIVDDLDLTALAVNWQQGCGGGGSLADSLAAANVPEPVSAVLLLAGFAGTIRRRIRG